MSKQPLEKYELFTDVIQKSEDRVNIFLESIFREFENASIRFCVLRWNEKLWIGEGDMDILVEASSMDVAVSIAASVAKEHAAVAMYDVKNGYHRHLFISFPDMRSEITQTLPLDFQSEIYEGGKVFSTTKDIFDSIETKNGYPCLESPMQAALIVVRAVVGKQFFKSGYWIFVKKVCGMSLTELNAILLNLFGKNLSKKIIECIVEDDLKGLLLLRREFLDSGGRCANKPTKSLFQRLLRRLSWYIFPPGIFVALKGRNNTNNVSVGRALFSAIRGVPCQKSLVHFPEKKVFKGGGLIEVLLNRIKRARIYLQHIRPILARDGVIIAEEYYVVGGNKAQIDRVGKDAIRHHTMMPLPHITVYLDHLDELLDERKTATEVRYLSSRERMKNGFVFHHSTTEKTVIAILQKIYLLHREKVRAPSLLNKLVLARGKLTISIIGLDGAGKGTYIDLLMKEYEKKGINNKSCYLGYSSYRLRWLKNIDGLKKKYTTGFFRKLLMVAYLVLLPFDFLVRRGIGTYDVLVTDRHPMYEPVFKGDGRLYDRFVAFLCPSPDIVFYLTGNTEVLWSRKKEHDFHVYKEKSRRLDRLVKLHSSSVKTIEVDTVDSIPNVFCKIRSVLS